MADIVDEHGNPIELTDELGRRVQLTDEHGHPIHLTGVATTEDHSEPHAGRTTIGSELNMHGDGIYSVPSPTNANVGGGAPSTYSVPTELGGGAPLTHSVAPPMTDGEGPLTHSVAPPMTGGGGPLSHPVPVTGGVEGEKFGRNGSTSSSSEDDGEGGRRRKKKGLMQKIKEKLPGGHKNKEAKPKTPEKVYTATTKVSVITPAGPVDGPKTEFVRVEHHEEEHEKKGNLMDKIKDKLPGHH